MADTGTPVPTHAAWTVAINLAVNLDSVGPYGKMGAEDKLNKLRMMAESTRGSAVTMVVQAVSKDPQPADGGEQTYSLKRYVIKDGTMQEVWSGRSQSVSQDTTDLLRYATEHEPSKKLALVINSHGEGESGLLGDNGRATVPQLQKAIADGLAGSTHSKLDLLDFDACLMAQVGVLESMAPVAHHLVASADMEDTDAQSDSVLDGQNLNFWLHRLVVKPEMDAGQLADAIVDDANKGSNQDAKGTDATKTLAHFDLGKPFQKFDVAFSAFGDALTDAAAKPENREFFSALSNSGPSVGPRGLGIMGSINGCNGFTPDLLHGFFRQQKRDLGGIADLVEQQIKTGRMVDFDGRLTRAVENLRSTQSEMMPAFHGPPKQGFYSSSGVTVFYPSAQCLDSKELSLGLTGPGKLLKLTSPDAPQFLRKMNVPHLEQAAVIAETDGANSDEARPQLRQMREALTGVHTATGEETPASAEAFAASERMLRQSAQTLTGVSPFAEQIANYKAGFDKVIRDFTDGDSAPSNQSWKGFIHTIK